MKLRKLKLDWRYGVSELLIIVCGVLIALAADGWREDRQDREVEREYVDRLRRDLESDTVALADLIELSRQRAGYGLAVLRALETGEPLEPPEEFLRAVGRVTWFGYPSYARTTIEDLRSTGNLRLLRDLEVREALSEYYAQIDFFEQFRDIFVPTKLELERLTREVLVGPDMRGAMFNEWISSNCGPGHSCGSQIPWVPTSLEVSATEAERVLDRLLARDDAPGLYTDMAHIHGMHYSNLSDIRQLAVRTLETLDRYSESLR